MLHWWIAWLVVGLVERCRRHPPRSFSTGTALALSVPAALACLAVIAWAPGIVTAIAAAHRDADGALSRSRWEPRRLTAFGLTRPLRADYPRIINSSLLR